MERMIQLVFCFSFFILKTKSGNKPFTAAADVINERTRGENTGAEIFVRLHHKFCGGSAPTFVSRL